LSRNVLSIKKQGLYMNYINELCLCIVTLVSFSCLGMMHQVIRDENGFRVFDGQQEHMVKPYFVDSLLKRMNPEQVQRFIERGNRIRAIRLSDGEYRLQAMVPVKGGGPISGLIAYGATKVIGFGIITAIKAAPIAVLTAAPAIIYNNPQRAITMGAMVIASATSSSAKPIVNAAAKGLAILFTAIPFLP
jgi:hypothetical protein